MYTDITKPGRLVQKRLQTEKKEDDIDEGIERIEEATETVNVFPIPLVTTLAMKS